MFLSWGRPFQLVSPLVSNTSNDSTPAQVECGWAFTSVLTKSGDVLVWWPGGRMLDQITSKNDEMDSQGDKKACATEHGVIPCVTWDLDLDPIRLPALPPLPRLEHIGETDDEGEPRLIQIAGLDNSIVGLTQHGHVLKIAAQDEVTASRSAWEYVSSLYYLDRTGSTLLSATHVQRG
jgi:SCF-associated factor 1